MSGEGTRRERFKRVATNRTEKVLRYLRLLGKCSNKNNYSYTQDDVKKIFKSIKKELRRVEHLFEEPKKTFSLKGA